jgi:hypothetical protein
VIDEYSAALHAVKGTVCTDGYSPHVSVIANTGKDDLSA